MSICSICLQECENTTSLPCGHTFHAECLVPWLWKSNSCPNCRLSENNSDNETNVNDIRIMIQELRANRQEQNNKFRENIRKSNNKNANKELRKTVQAYYKCKNKKKDDIIEKKTIQKHINNVKKEVNHKLNTIYKNYLTEYSNIEKNEKNKLKGDCKKLSAISNKLRRREYRLLELRNKIVQY